MLVPHSSFPVHLFRASCASTMFPIHFAGAASFVGMTDPMPSGLPGCALLLPLPWVTDKIGFGNIRYRAFCMTWAGQDSIGNSSERYGPGRRPTVFPPGRVNGVPYILKRHMDVRRRHSSGAMDRHSKPTASR